MYVGRLFRMGGNSLPEPVWISVRNGFSGKGELNVWLVMASNWEPP